MQQQRARRGSEGLANRHHPPPQQLLAFYLHTYDCQKDTPSPLREDRTHPTRWHGGSLPKCSSPAGIVTVIMAMQTKLY